MMPQICLASFLQRVGLFLGFSRTPTPPFPVIARSHPGYGDSPLGRQRWSTHEENPHRLSACWRPLFFTFPEDARWTAERQAVEFGVEIRRVPRGGPGAAARVPRAIAGAAHPREAYYLQRTRFEAIAERKLRPAAVDRGWECGDQRAGLGVLLTLVCFR
jgi:hypothetical protein